MVRVAQFAGQHIVHLDFDQYKMKERVNFFQSIQAG
jgi:hypothetical protein